MRIDVSLLKDDEIVVIEKEYRPDILELEFDDLEYVEPLKLKGEAKKVKELLLVSGVLTSKVQRTCARCLAKIPQKIDENIELSYDVKGKKFIDITPEIRDALLLGHPMKFICKENCKGLCPKCGVNLNEKSCGCEFEQKEHGLSKLKEWYTRKKGE